MAIRRKQLQISLDPDTVERIARLKYGTPGINGDVSKLIRQSLKEMEDRQMADMTILASAHTVNGYGFEMESYLVLRDGQHWLIHDVFGTAPSASRGVETVHTLIFKISPERAADIQGRYSDGYPQFYPMIHLEDKHEPTWPGIKFCGPESQANHSWTHALRGRWREANKEATA